MKKTISLLTKIIVLFGLLIVSCQNNKINNTTVQNKLQSSPIQVNLAVFDSSLVSSFFKQHPDFKKFQKEVIALYQKQNYNYIWFDQKGIKEVGYLLYNKATTLSTEGIESKIPYQDELDAVFQDENGNEKPEVTVELLISSMYFYYVNKVYKGLAIEKRNELGWYLPRKKQSFVNYLDSILAKPSLINKDEKEISGQYYRLREVLKKYRTLEK
jgi:murein L,D-transpeptidase YcbB/YkuD